MKCPFCNSQIKDNSMFCPICGKSLREVYEKPEPEKFRNEFNDERYRDMYRSNVRKKRNNTSPVPIVIIIILLIIIMFLGIKLFVPGFMSAPVSAPTHIIPPPPTATAVVSTEKPTEAPTEAPVSPDFPEIRVSSTRGVDYEDDGTPVYYYAEFMLDDVMETCWTPERKNDYTPWIELSADEEQYVSGILFSDGYFKSEETYTKNNRISKIEVSYEGERYTYSFDEHVYGYMQNVSFPEPVYTDKIKIRILDWISGPWKDVCVSEIKVY